MSDEPVPKVVSLRGGGFAEPGIPIQNVIRTLEDLLERARSGSLQGVVVACVNSDDTTMSVRAGVVTRSLVGMTEILKLGIIQDLGDL